MGHLQTEAIISSDSIPDQSRTEKVFILNDSQSSNDNSNHPVCYFACINCLYCAVSTFVCVVQLQTLLSSALGKNNEKCVLHK